VVWRITVYKADVVTLNNWCFGESGISLPRLSLNKCCKTSLLLITGKCSFT